MMLFHVNLAVPDMREAFCVISRAGGWLGALWTERYRTSGYSLKHMRFVSSSSTCSGARTCRCRGAVARFLTMTVLPWQNIDLMNLSGFCRNCLSKWLLAGAAPFSYSAPCSVLRAPSVLRP